MSARPAVVRGAPTPLAAVVLAAGALVSLTACGGATGEADGPGAGTAPDTVRGTVAVVGADPATHVVVETDGGRLRVRGPAADGLRRVAGLDVRVDGRLDGATLTATGFRVRELDSLPAADGVLEIDGDAAVLVTPSGERVRYSPVPAALRARAGARVWIAGRPGQEPQAWGLIGG